MLGQPQLFLSEFVPNELFSDVGERVLINTVGDIRVRPTVFEVNLHTSKSKCETLIRLSSHKMLTLPSYLGQMRKDSVEVKHTDYIP